MGKAIKIGVIGLGYVGLPLSVAFAEKYPTIGYDIDETRVNELLSGHDRTREIESDVLKDILKGSTVPDAPLGKAKSEGLESTKALEAQIGGSQFEGIEGSKVPEALSGGSQKEGLEGRLNLTSILSDLSNCNIFIVTVPTPINKFKSPDLSFLLEASKQVGSMMKKGAIVIFESTVYPGCTEEDCVPELEKASGLIFNKDFFCGYSPERINPGDKIRTLTKIIKVTSGSTPKVATQVDNLYKSIITAGTHLAPSIKVAEASKAIENAQRDVNISFVNELALIFDRMKINTLDVLEAAGTKWNFLPFKPGLVGGHCIGVDPYYLAHKAESLGYHPQVILSGRRVNDYMPIFVANKVVKTLIKEGKPVKDAKILILGFTFKPNCPDTRNTKVIEVYRELESFECQVQVYDPWVDVNENNSFNFVSKDNIKNIDILVHATNHEIFEQDVLINKLKETIPVVGLLN
ncbi:MAG: UDP-N-acetyl-D-galactosamine dehydrogenase [Sphingobacteriales bacterium]